MPWVELGLATLIPPTLSDPAMRSMSPWIVQFLHFTLKPTLTDYKKEIDVNLSEKETHISELGPLTESVPKDASGGRIDVSSHCLLKLALPFQLLGVDEGAAGYATDEVADTYDVAAACRGSSLPCRRSTNLSSLLPKSSVIESKVFFQGILVIERTMTRLSRSRAASDIL